MSKRTCPECGARLREGADRCDLCGLAIGAGSDEYAGAPISDATEPQPPVTAADAGPSLSEDANESQSPFCNECGSENVPGSRFCSQCGARLQSAAVPAGRPPVKRAEGPPVDDELDEMVPTVGVGRHLSIVIGSSLLLVIALFLINVVSSQTGRERSGPTTAPPQTAPPQAAPVAAGDVLGEHASLPLAPEQNEAVIAIEEEIARLEGEARQAKQQELVQLLAGFGRLDRAAIVQQEIAEAENTTEAWRTAGDLWFDWMEAVGGEHQGQVAMLAVQAYERVLEKEPDNLDVRADMAWAYQYDPRSPMEAITQNNYVLEQDPDHVQANFNRGIFLMRINRFDQATQQFEHLQGLVGEADPVYRQAQAMIDVIREAKTQ